MSDDILLAALVLVGAIALAGYLLGIWWDNDA